MFWSKNKIIKQTRQAIYAELEEERIANEQRKKEIDVLVLSEHIGKLVICVSNEIENITVGYGKEIIFLTKSQQPFLVVHDIVNDCEVVPFGKIFAYTEQKFDALNMMDHNARIAILYSADGTHHVSKEESQRGVPLDSLDWNLKVKTAVANWLSKNEHADSTYMCDISS